MTKSLSRFAVATAGEATLSPLLVVLAVVAGLFVGCKSAEKAPLMDARAVQESLWDAARSGDVQTLALAIRNGANVDALDVRTSQNGRRALNWAAWFNHPEIITELLRNGADIDAVNLTGFTPIQHAAESGSVDAARVLIAAGADLDLASFGDDNRAGETPLQRAVRDGHEEIARLLVKAGAK